MSGEDIPEGSNRYNSDEGCRIDPLEQTKKDKKILPGRRDAVTRRTSTAEPQEWRRKQWRHEPGAEPWSGGRRTRGVQGGEENGAAGKCKNASLGETETKTSTPALNLEMGRTGTHCGRRRRLVIRATPGSSTGSRRPLARRSERLLLPRSRSDSTGSSDP